MKLKLLYETTFTANDNGDLYYQKFFVGNYGDKEEALGLAPDVVIGPNGVQYIREDTGLPYIDTAHEIVLDTSYLIGEYLYKATNNIASPQVPGFMTDKEDVKQYLTGARSKHYGGKFLIRTKIADIGKLAESTLVDSANCGQILLLPGTPDILDFGGDGIFVAQEVVIENMHLGKTRRNKRTR